MSELKAGREMDARVAVEVMGWGQMPGPSPQTSEWFQQNYWESYKYFRTVPVGEMLAGLEREVFHYSKSIRDAWGILEHLESDPRRILSEITRKLNDNGTRFVYQVVLRQCTPPFPRHWFAEDESAPLAICLAALKAISQSTTPESPALSSSNKV